MQHRKPRLRRYLYIPLSLAVLLIVLVPPPSTSADLGTTISIYSSASDGHLKRTDDDGWEAMREAEEASGVYDTLRYIKVDTRTGVIYRGFLYFETIGIPRNATITSASLVIYAKCTMDRDECQLYVVSGMPDCPHEPLCARDYDRSHYSSVACGFADIGDWTELAYRTVSLEQPDELISKGGTTKLCLMERRDFENDPPPDERSENEYKMYAHEEGEGFQPYLSVTYQTGTARAADSDETGQAGATATPIPWWRAIWSAWLSQS